MKNNSILWDIGMGVACGYLATKVMEATMPQLNKIKSEETKQRERELSPHSPAENAVSQMERVTGTELSESQHRMASSTLHYGTGITGGLAYVMMKRFFGMSPIASGLAAGAGVWVLVDETMSPLLGYTKSPQKYPFATHSTALIAHLVYGGALAAADLTIRALIPAAKQTARSMHWTGKSGMAAGKLYLIKKAVDSASKRVIHHRKPGIGERVARRIRQAA